MSKNHRQNYKYFVNVVEQRKVHLLEVKHRSIHFAKSVILEGSNQGENPSKKAYSLFQFLEELLESIYQNLGHARN